MSSDTVLPPGPTVFVRRHAGAWQVAFDAQRQWQPFPGDNDDSEGAKLLHACLAVALKLGEPFLRRADQSPGVAFILRGRPD